MDETASVRYFFSLQLQYSIFLYKKQSTVRTFSQKSVVLGKDSIMDYELKLYINGKEETAFLQSGFFDVYSTSPSLHRHNYTEIHVIKEGSASFRIGNKIYDFEAGSVFILPAGLFHCCSDSSCGMQSVAFQITAPAAHFAVCRAPLSLLAEVTDCIAAIRSPNVCAKLSALLSYLCADFFAADSELFSEISDPVIVIQEFLSLNYSRSPSLAELAALLHFSEKQTERLVKKHTGYPFKRAVAEYRMTVARYLETSTQMTAAEIAAYVGYSTYNGYWKARKRKATDKAEE